MLNRLLILIALGFCSLSAAGAQGRLPNIVILFADDLGYADLGSYGNPYIRTPELDRMAREGQRWTDFYMAAPVCSPSRGALLTGQVSVRSGLYGRKMQVMFPDDPHGIPDVLLTLPEALKSAGYQTGMFGKWHLGDAPENYPTRHGFDYWFGIPYSNDMRRPGVPGIEEVVRLMEAGRTQEVMQHFSAAHKLYESPKSEFWHVPLIRSQKHGAEYEDELLENALQQPTFTRRLTEEAVKFIETNKRDPFLVYLPYSMPHLPVFASEQFSGKSLRGAYGDAVEELDWSVGKIREALERLGLAENTLVIFSSDNGPWKAISATGSGSAGMLRGSKGTTYEGGMRVPGVFWWPGQVKPGTVSDIGSALDVYATALRLAGVELPAATDGLDLSSTLLGGAPGPRTEMPYYFKGKLAAYRKGAYKLYLYADGNADKPLDKPELYDLRQDLSEEANIADKHPEIVADLMAAVEQHRKGVVIAEPVFDLRFGDK